MSLEKSVRMVWFMLRSQGVACSPSPYTKLDGRRADSWRNCSEKISPVEVEKLERKKEKNERAGGDTYYEWLHKRTSKYHKQTNKPCVHTIIYSGTSAQCHSVYKPFFKDWLTSRHKSLCHVESWQSKRNALLCKSRTSLYSCRAVYCIVWQVVGGVHLPSHSNVAYHRNTKQHSMSSSI